MKKIFLIILIIISIFLTGCGNNNGEDLKKKFFEEVENLKGYHLEGTLSITNNDDNYNYDVSVSYEKEDLYKVTLINQSNNYEQTILKNESGVYVVNPSLNRSFRFQSEWPYNNSQSYLLQSIKKDLEDDSNYEFYQENNTYVFITKVDYPNNSDLVSQKIVFDKNMTLTRVEVMDEKEIPHITFNVTSIDNKAIFTDNYFALETISKDFNNKETNKEKEITETLSIDEALFPLYLPESTSLTSREAIDTISGQRVIMTFGGSGSFILVQETIEEEKELVVVPSYGEPYQLIDTIGALTDTSYTWISNNVEYYIVSDVLSQKELLEVARSMNVIATIGEK